VVLRGNRPVDFWIRFRSLFVCVCVCACVPVFLNLVSLFVEEFFLDSVVSVFAYWARIYSNRFRPCISIGGHFEISTKSNNVPTGRPRITKLSGLIALDDPTLPTRHGAPPPSRLAARGR